LKENVPDATITVRNKATETPLASLSRLVLATSRVVCTGCSTFCVWGAVGSQAVGAWVPSSDLYPWVANVPSGTHTVDAPLLTGAMVARQKLDADGVVRWLRQSDPLMSQPTKQAVL